MISIGIMIIILVLFLVAIGVSFYSGFSVGKKIEEIEPKVINVAVDREENPIYVEPKQSLFDKALLKIENLLDKNNEEDKDVKTVVTEDGKVADENSFYD